MKLRNIAFIVSLFPLFALYGCLSFPDGTDPIAVEKGMTVPELLSVVFPHPTVGEILKETLSTL